MTKFRYAGMGFGAVSAIVLVIALHGETDISCSRSFGPQCDIAKRNQTDQQALARLAVLQWGTADRDDSPDRNILGAPVLSTIGTPAKVMRNTPDRVGQAIKRNLCLLCAPKQSPPK
jgi:hypothetical protein